MYKRQPKKSAVTPWSSAASGARHRGSAPTSAESTPRLSLIHIYEEESQADFDRLNEELFRESEKANKYANALGPILHNIGNVL